jgi:hypothetical protein
VSYFCSVSYLAIKEYRGSLEAFLTCITTPANVLSQIVINAIKKCKLISLLLKGEKFELPRFALPDSLLSFH